MTFVPCRVPIRTLEITNPAKITNPANHLTNRSARYALEHTGKGLSGRQLIRHDLHHSMSSTQERDIKDGDVDHNERTFAFTEGS